MAQDTTNHEKNQYELELEKWLSDAPEWLQPHSVTIEPKLNDNLGCYLRIHLASSKKLRR